MSENGGKDLEVPLGASEGKDLVDAATKAKQEIDRIIEDSNNGIRTQGAEKKLIEFFTQLSDGDMENCFKRYPKDMREKVLLAAVPQFQGKRDVFLKLLTHTQAYKIYGIAKRGFSKVGTEGHNKKKELDYWYSLSPDQRMLIWPFLAPEDRPGRASFFAKGVLRSIPVAVLYAVELAWRGAAKFFGIGGSFAFPLCEALNDVANRIRAQIENWHDFETWSRLGEISRVVDRNTDVNSVLTQAGKEQVSAEQELEKEFLKLTNPGRNRAETDPEKLATLFGVMGAREQIEYFSVLQNPRVQFFLLGKRVIKDEAVPQCCELIEKHYKVDSDGALTNFKKANITSSNGKMNVMHEGKKIFDLHRVRASGGKVPSAAWEITKGVLKILGIVVAIGLCVSWLTVLPLALAGLAGLGLSAVAIKVVGFGASCVLTALISKWLAKFKIVGTLNPVDNIGKAVLISRSNSIAKQEENSLVKVENEKLSQFQNGLYRRNKSQDEGVDEQSENDKQVTQDQNLGNKFIEKKNLGNLSIVPPIQVPSGELEKQE